MWAGRIQKDNDDKFAKLVLSQIRRNKCFEIDNAEPTELSGPHSPQCCCFLYYIRSNWNPSVEDSIALVTCGIQAQMDTSTDYVEAFVPIGRNHRHCLASLTCEMGSKRSN